MKKYQIIPPDDVKTKNDEDAKRNDETNHDNALALTHETQNDEHHNGCLGLIDHF